MTTRGTEQGTEAVTSGARQQLTTGTLVAAALAVALAQIGLSLPAVLNGLFQGDLQPSSTQLTWATDAFLIPITLFELTFGVVGDLFGRKRLLAAGSALVVVGGLISFLTPGPGTAHGVRLTYLYSGQVIAGLGAAALFPTSIAMLAAGTHTVRDRSHAISIWAAALTGGAFLSPLFSGALARIEHSGGPEASWRWAFLAMAFLGLVSTVVTLALATSSSSPQGRSLDWPGQITVAVALFALLFGVIQGGEAGWGSAEAVGSFLVAVVFFALFVLAERRTSTPLLQISLFSNRVFVGTAVVTVIGMFAYLGTGYATSIRLSAIQGYSPLSTAIGFVCLNVMGVVLFPVSSWMLEKFNAGWILAIGMGCIAIGDLCLAAIPATNLSIAAVAVPLLVIGIGFKIAVTAITVVAVNSVPTSKAGMASGATSMLRDFGLTLGPAVVGSIALSHAAAEVSAKVAAAPKVEAALRAFNASPAKAPASARPALEGAVGAVSSGPLGANGVPATMVTSDGRTIPFNPIKDIAFHALSGAFQLGYLICGVAALVAAVIAIVVVAGRDHQHSFVDEA